VGMFPEVFGMADGRSESTEGRSKPGVGWRLTSGEYICIFIHKLVIAEAILILGASPIFQGQKFTSKNSSFQNVDLTHPTNVIHQKSKTNLPRHREVFYIILLRTKVTVLILFLCYIVHR